MAILESCRTQTARTITEGGLLCLRRPPGCCFIANYNKPADRVCNANSEAIDSSLYA